MSADNQQERLNTNWIVGFVDGEGCFYVGKNYPRGYLQFLPEFRIVQHKKDIDLLFKLKSFFGCGIVTVNHGDRMELRVRGIQNLKAIINFFKKHKLQTKKKEDFEKFSIIINIMDKKEHLTKEGVEIISKLIGRMNRCQCRYLESSETICQTSKDEDIVRT